MSNWFQPFLNPTGFGAADWIELFIAAPLFLFLLARAPIARWFSRLAARPAIAMAIAAALPVVLRLALLSHHPVPVPDLYDEFTHLLVADTLRHGRLANPPHALAAFFETFFVLQQPTYSAIYPIGQGAALALGWLLFGTPWAGVLVSVAALGGAMYWMLRAWTTAEWALIGALLGATIYGPLSYWANTYWGGAVAAAAGCLVFGALPRLRRADSLRDAMLLGAGFGLHLLTRPYESLFLFAAAAAYVLLFVKRMRPAVLILPILAGAITLAHNRQVTGSVLKLPLMASQARYGVPTSLRFVAKPVPDGPLTQEQQMSYTQQNVAHDKARPALHLVRFFLPAALWLALPAAFARRRERQFQWLFATLALFLIGASLYPFFFPHYVAAVAGLFVVASIEGVRTRSAAAIVIWFALAPFAFWYTLHLTETPGAPYYAFTFEVGDVLNHGNPQRRIAVAAQLAEAPGKQLVFVRYSPRHVFQEEWVYNAADIGNARVVWARDLGEGENARLIDHYRDRKPWLLEPDHPAPLLSEYPSAPPEKPAETQPRKPVLRFEEVK